MMPEDSALMARQISPEDVLRVLNGHVLLVCTGDAGLTTEPLEMDTPLTEWGERVMFEGFDLFEADVLLQALFNVPAEHDELIEWFSSGVPPTLAQLCESVAERARLPDITPAHVAGIASLEAGCFLALKSALEESQVDTTDISPSAFVDPWMMKRADAVLIPLLRFTRGALPPLRRVQHPLSRAGGAMCWREGLCLMVAGLIALASGAFDILMTSILGLGFGMTSVALGERLCPTHLRFNDDLTFRDLCEWMAEIHTTR